jgi:hypothetical protein
LWAHLSPTLYRSVAPGEIWNLSDVVRSPSLETPLNCDFLMPFELVVELPQRVATRLQTTCQLSPNLFYGEMEAPIGLESRACRIDCILNAKHRRTGYVSFLQGRPHQLINIEDILTGRGCKPVTLSIYIVLYIPRHMLEQGFGLRCWPIVQETP